MLHFHGLQRHDRLTGGDALARPDQNGNDTAVHRRANLAVAIHRGRRYRRCQCQIADRKRDAPVQDVKAIAVPEKSRYFHHSVGAETDRIGIKLVDFEPALVAIAACDITAIALTYDL